MTPRDAGEGGKPSDVFARLALREVTRRSSPRANCCKRLKSRREKGIKIIEAVTSRDKSGELLMQLDPVGLALKIPPG